MITAKDALLGKREEVMCELMEKYEGETVARLSGLDEAVGLNKGYGA